MEVLKILGIGIVTCLVVIIVKQVKPEFSVVLLITGSCIILYYIIGYFADILHVFDNIMAKTGINTDLFTTILKIVGIGYLIEFGAGVCVDSGNPSIADKIILAGKLIILIVAMPIITNLLNTIIGLVQWKNL